MAARKKTAATFYRVKGPVAVIRRGRQERYVNHGALIAVDALDETNAQHLLSLGLIVAATEAAPTGDAATQERDTPPEPGAESSAVEAAGQ